MPCSGRGVEEEGAADGLRASAGAGCPSGCAEKAGVGITMTLRRRGGGWAGCSEDEEDEVAAVLVRVVEGDGGEEHGRTGWLRRSRRWRFHSGLRASISSPAQGRDRE